MKKIIGVVAVFLVLLVQISITTFAAENILSGIRQQGSAICEYDVEKDLLHLAGRNIADTGSAELKTYNFGKKTSNFIWEFEYTPMDANWATDTFYFCSSPANMRFTGKAYALQICGSLAASKTSKSQLTILSPEGQSVISADNVSVSAFKNYLVKISVDETRIDVWFCEKGSTIEKPTLSYTLSEKLEQGYFLIKSWAGNFTLSNMTVNYQDNAILGESPDTSDKSSLFVYIIIFIGSFIGCITILSLERCSTK